MLNFLRRNKIPLAICGAVTTVGIICAVAGAPAAAAVLILVGITGLGVVAYRECMRSPTF